MAFRALQPASMEPGAASTQQAAGTSPRQAGDVVAGSPVEQQLESKHGGAATAASQSCQAEGLDSDASRTKGREALPDIARKAGQG